MNNRNNEMDPIPDWSPTDFEQELRARSLGSGPRHRDELMYQCGHAAGVAATKRELQRVNWRWRYVAMAGSLLALVSLSSHLPLFQVNLEGESAYREAQSNGMNAELETAAQPASDSWIRQLVGNRPVAHQASGILRASTQTLPNSTTDRLDIPQSIEQDDPSMILRPNDFPHFL